MCIQSENRFTHIKPNNWTLCGETLEKKNEVSCEVALKMFHSPDTSHKNVWAIILHWVG